MCEPCCYRDRHLVDPGAAAVVGPGRVALKCGLGHRRVVEDAAKGGCDASAICSRSIHAGWIEQRCLLPRAGRASPGRRAGRYAPARPWKSGPLRPAIEWHGWRRVLTIEGPLLSARRVIRTPISIIRLHKYRWIDRSLTGALTAATYPQRLDHLPSMRGSFREPMERRLSAFTRSTRARSFTPVSPFATAVRIRPGTTQLQALRARVRVFGSTSWPLAAQSRPVYFQQGGPPTFWMQGRRVGSPRHWLTRAIRASSLMLPIFGLAGTESPDEIEARPRLMALLDRLRRLAGVAMQLGQTPEDRWTLESKDRLDFGSLALSNPTWRGYRTRHIRNRRPVHFHGARTSSCTADRRDVSCGRLPDRRQCGAPAGRATAPARRNRSRYALRRLVGRGRGASGTSRLGR